MEACNLHKTDVLLTEKIYFLSTADQILSLPSATCSHFPARGFHPFSSSIPIEHTVCMAMLEVRRVESLQRGTETKNQTMAGETETT